jgi:hypothetical protein
MAKYPTEDILEGARSIRPYLAKLLEADSEVVDHELSDLLAKAQVGQKIDNQILDLLSRQESTRVWIVQYLALKRPPEQEVERLYSGLPGESVPPPVPKYACPRGDYVWYRPAVGVEVRDCPTHHIRLEPIPQ